MQLSHSEQAAHLRQGVKVFIGLAALTGIEFGAAAAYRANSVFPLLAIAFGKVVLIAIYFMHAGELFRGDEGESE